MDRSRASLRERELMLRLRATRVAASEVIVAIRALTTRMVT